MAADLEQSQREPVAVEDRPLAAALLHVAQRG
jgi:hypothetical protein